MPTPADDIKSGDELRALEAMRDMLADRMIEAEASVVAQIAGRLQSVVGRIAELGAANPGESRSDEIAERRANRRAAAAVGKGSGRVG